MPFHALMENIMLKEQVCALIHENTILKRVVSIQHERQKELDDKVQELQHLKQMVYQFQEQLRTLESNEFFSLFLGETMMYSCAIFKSKNEDLKEAQMRKISLLIEKARISKEHEILEIGCGWGSFAIEVINKTGCNYTGITLSEEQLKFAEMKIKEAGLQDSELYLKEQEQWVVTGFVLPLFYQRDCQNLHTGPFFDVITNVVGLIAATLANYFSGWMDPVGAIISRLVHHPHVVRSTPLWENLQRQNIYRL